MLVTAMAHSKRIFVPSNETQAGMVTDDDLKNTTGDLPERYCRSSQHLEKHFMFVETSNITEFTRAMATSFRETKTAFSVCKS